MAAIAPANTGASTSKSPAPYGEAFNRITSVPLVSQTLNLAHQTLESHSLLAQPYHFGGNVVSSSLKAAEPVTTRIQPQLALLDDYAVKSLNFAESKWSYPFHATTDDVYKNARAPADQAIALLHAYYDAVQKTYAERVVNPAKGLYDARVAPVYNQANTQFQELTKQNQYLQRATEIVSNLQTNLAKTIDSISSRGKADGEQAVQKAQGLSNAIFAELERVRGYATALPAESRKRVEPVLQTFNETFDKLNKEARDTSVPAFERFRKVLSFVREQSLPALQKVSSEFHEVRLNLRQSPCHRSVLLTSSSPH